MSKFLMNLSVAVVQSESALQPMTAVCHSYECSRRCRVAFHSLNCESCVRADPPYGQPTTLPLGSATTAEPNPLPTCGFGSGSRPASVRLAGVCLDSSDSPESRQDRRGRRADEGRRCGIDQSVGNERGMIESSLEKVIDGHRSR